MKKKPNPGTPDERAADFEARRELDRRIAAITAELVAVSSHWLEVADEDQLAYAIARIDAELVA